MNDSNLRVPTSEQARENGRKGGIASGKKRKEAKALKDCFALLCSLPVKDPKLKARMNQLGIKNNEQTNAMLMAIGIWQKACKGDAQAFDRVEAKLNETAQETAQQEESKEIVNALMGRTSDVPTYTEEDEEDGE